MGQVPRPLQGFSGALACTLRAGRRAPTDLFKRSAWLPCGEQSGDQGGSGHW